MTLQILFWFLMILWAVFSVWSWRDPINIGARGGWYTLVFVLFAILGWAIFGAPIKG